MEATYTHTHAHTRTYIPPDGTPHCHSLWPVLYGVDVVVACSGQADVSVWTSADAAIAHEVIVRTGVSGTHEVCVCEREREGERVRESFLG